jgi:hypothetical protein
VNFREWYGLAPKVTFRCPICTVETKGSKGKPVKCKTHAQQGRPHHLKHRALYRLIASAIDEARS